VVIIRESIWVQSKNKILKKKAPAGKFISLFFNFSPN